MLFFVVVVVTCCFTSSLNIKMYKAEKNPQKPVLGDLTTLRTLQAQTLKQTQTKYTQTHTHTLCMCRGVCMYVYVCE